MRKVLALLLIIVFFFGSSMRWPERRQPSAKRVVEVDKFVEPVFFSSSSWFYKAKRLVVKSVAHNEGRINRPSG